MAAEHVQRCEGTVILCDLASRPVMFAGCVVVLSFKEAAAVPQRPWGYCWVNGGT